MATQLFFIPSSQRLPGIHRGTNTANLAGTAIGWTPNLLSATRGTAALSTNVTSVLGPTNGVEGTNEWLSMPLAAAVTISGTITLNLWSSESNASANGAVNAIIQRLDSTGAIVSTIAQTARTTELGTSAAAANFTVTPTSTNMAKGDRFRVRVYFDDAAAVTMASGFTFAFSRGAATVTTGDSYVTFTETFTLQTTVPAGTTLYPTTTTGPAVGANDEFEMWTSPGGAATTAVTNRVLGWTAPVQWTGTGGGTAIEWYSRPLTAFTLAGLVECNLRAFASALSGIRAELAVCNGDGSSPVVWGGSDLIDQATPEAIQGAGTFGDGQMKTTETAIMGWLAGADVNVTNGQRLRLRVFLDDTATSPLAATGTASFVYNGPTAAATGDSWIQLPQTVTEYVASAPSLVADVKHIRRNVLLRR